MRRLLILLVILSSCKSGIKQSIPLAKSNSYVVQVKDRDVQDYFERLGLLSIGVKEYDVWNHFRRVKAAENWHGQPSLIFLREGDTITYRLNSNDDFPSAIHADQLFFPQTGSGKKIDTLTNILCLPTGCVEREENSSDVFYVQLDSIAHVFRGGYLPD